MKKIILFLFGITLNFTVYAYDTGWWYSGSITGSKGDVEYEIGVYTCEQAGKTAGNYTVNDVSDIKSITTQECLTDGNLSGIYTLYVRYSGCPIGEFYIDGQCSLPPSCPDGSTPDVDTGECPVNQCDTGLTWSEAYQICAPTCGDGEYYSPADNRCVPNRNCPSDDWGDSAAFAIPGESQCISGCVAQYVRGGTDSGFTAGYFYTGDQCGMTGSGCHDEFGGALACGDNPDNDPEEDPKPDPNEADDPLEDEHGKDGAGGEDGGKDMPENGTSDCDSLSHYYYDSSDPAQSPPPSAYSECPDKVHDQKVVDPEDTSCEELPIWNWSSSNRFTDPPPPEYDDCPSRVNDTNPNQEEESQLCKAGEICDTTFSDGQDEICDKAPICIEDDNFQCVVLRMQWEDMCKYELEDEYKNLTGLSSALGDADANYMTNADGSDFGSSVDVSDFMNQAANGWGWARSCPAPETVTIMGHSFTLENAYLCLFLGYAGNLLVLFSLLGAGRMMFS